jgi:hypothetical protein
VRLFSIVRNERFAAAVQAAKFPGGQERRGGERRETKRRSDGAKQGTWQLTSSEPQQLSVCSRLIPEATDS